MAYSEKLADRIRIRLEERFMFGGVYFMLKGKMCIGIVQDEMMCRIGAEVYETALEKRGCREMIFTGKPMKGYVYVSDEGMKSKKDFEDNTLNLRVTPPLRKHFVSGSLFSFIS